MKKAVIGTLFGVLGFGVCLVATVPAAWVWHLLPQKPAHIQLYGISGSVWQGQVEQVVIDGRPLEQLQWQLLPRKLLTGALGGTLKITGNPVQAHANIQYGWSGLTIENGRFHTPLSWLVGQQKLLMNVQVGGSSTLTLRTYQQGQPWCEQLQGRLLVTGLDINSSMGAYALGDLAGDLRCQQGQLILQMDANENRIGIAGELRLMAANRIDINATIRPTEEQPASLKTLLPMLGQADANGAYPFKYQGPVPIL